MQSNAVKSFELEIDWTAQTILPIEFRARELPIEARDYDLAAHILFDLGYPEIKLLTNNPAKVEALREEGVDVTEQLPLIVNPSTHNKRYLATKKERMAHKL